MISCGQFWIIIMHVIFGSKERAFLEQIAAFAEKR